MDEGIELIDAIKKKDFETFKKIIEEKEITDLNLLGNNGETPINYAVKYGTPEIVGYLIDKGICNINEVIGSEPTPLMVACIVEETEMVNLLIEKGADLEIKDSDGDTALLLAALYKNAHIICSLILAGANVDAKNNLGQNVYDILRTNLELNEFDREIINDLLLKSRVERKDQPYDIPLGGGKKRRKTKKIKKRSRRKSKKRSKKSKNT